ncbi:acetate/propionate family kinase [Thiovibrio frasassiensis]|uniref:Acetate kinase n=1 Tax=Thiovibrio frasassiensis TaxID=2984131 RepID=A0A9X4MF90_9BACT|nr:acetate kinase [Thiovibrio frasassiensis]MDG4475218.1 acetate kinase [Thiovibrio frasassiensis]
MKVLVLNSGSSSIKYQLFDMRDESVLAAGSIEQIGEPGSHLSYALPTGQPEMKKAVQTLPVPDHHQGFQRIAAVLKETGALANPGELHAIGHRVVHGGEQFQKPARVTPAVLSAIRELIPLAPLHNPANLLGIEVALESAPLVPQVAVFDTAFHQSLPSHAYRYAIPKKLYEAHQVRRYGFHGTSHYYVAKKAAEFLGKPLDSLNLISLHLGNGASAAAIQQGICIDTSMGFTPLEGLIMGTRCGDLDPAIIFYLVRETGLSAGEIETILNKESGLKGICGANDMRAVGELAERGNPEAQLAIRMYCYRIKKYIGAYHAVLGRLDGLIFTGGIGENADFIRAGCCEGLDHLGLEMNNGANRERRLGCAALESGTSRVKILVIPTNEELEIAEQTVTCLSSS